MFAYPFVINKVKSLLLLDRSYSNIRIEHFFSINMLKRSSDDPRNGLLKRRNPYQNSYILDIAVDVTQSAVERINPETNVLCWNLLVNFTF